MDVKCLRVWDLFALNLFLTLSESHLLSGTRFSYEPDLEGRMRSLVFYLLHEVQESEWVAQGSRGAGKT